MHRWGVGSLNLGQTQVELSDLTHVSLIGAPKQGVGRVVLITQLAPMSEECHKAFDVHRAKVRKGARSRDRT